MSTYKKDWQEPFSDNEMEYKKDHRRYVLKPAYIEEMGIDLSAELETTGHPEPELAPKQFLDRISKLVYSNIYQYGRTKDTKEYLLACDHDLRPIIRDAMLERMYYVLDSDDMSTKGGAIVSQGTRVETRDLIPSVMEEMILRPTGLLHRGEFRIIKDENLDY